MIEFYLSKNPTTYALGKVRTLYSRSSALPTMSRILSFCMKSMQTSDSSFPDFKWRYSSLWSLCPLIHFFKSIFYLPSSTGLLYVHKTLCGLGERVSHSSGQVLQTLTAGGDEEDEAEFMLADRLARRAGHGGFKSLPPAGLMMVHGELEA